LGLVAFSAVSLAITGLLGGVHIHLPVIGAFVLVALMVASRDKRYVLSSKKIDGLRKRFLTERLS
jgi:hypothetical protein